MTIIKKKNLQAINAGEDVEQTEPTHTVGGTVNWYRHQQYGDFFKKWNLSYDTAIPLLGIIPWGKNFKYTILKDT